MADIFYLVPDAYGTLQAAEDAIPVPLGGDNHIIEPVAGTYNERVALRDHTGGSATSRVILRPRTGLALPAGVYDKATNVNIVGDGLAGFTIDIRNNNFCLVQDIQAEITGQAGNLGVINVLFDCRDIDILRCLVRHTNTRTGIYARGNDRCDYLLCAVKSVGASSLFGFEGTSGLPNDNDIAGCISDGAANNCYNGSSLFRVWNSLGINAGVNAFASINGGDNNMSDDGSAFGATSYPNETIASMNFQNIATSYLNNGSSVLQNKGVDFAPIYVADVEGTPIPLGQYPIGYHYSVTVPPSGGNHDPRIFNGIGIGL